MLDIFYNKKNKKKYAIISSDAICTTNKYDGTQLVVYMSLETTQVFVRDKVEFYEKFEPVEI